MTSALEAQVREPVELTIDVTDEAALGMPARTTATVYLPETGALSSPPVVCFAFPGGGYSRRYYTLDLAGGASQASSNGASEADHGPPGHGQAGWHAARGWIFVACDSLGFGDATAPDGDVLTYENIALGNQATVAAVLARLESGTLADGYPPIRGATTVGLGQSMGGCFTIVLQGQHQVFDGIAALGFSGIHTGVPSRPGTPAAAWPWILRGSAWPARRSSIRRRSPPPPGPTLGGQE